MVPGLSFYFTTFHLSYTSITMQEEPLNCGPWTYVGARIMTSAGQTEHHKGKFPKYAGRAPTSSVATGSKVSALSSAGLCHDCLSDQIISRNNIRRRSKNSLKLLSLNKLSVETMCNFTFL